MGTNVLFFAWNRAIPGREKMSAEHFGEFIHYLEGLQRSGAIQSFDTVFLDAHGGDLNGFFLIRAEPTKLDALTATREWQAHVVRAILHLEGAGVVRGMTGAAVAERMQLWASHLPAQ